MKEKTMKWTAILPKKIKERILARDAEAEAVTGALCWTINIMNLDERVRATYRLKVLEDTIIYLKSKIEQYKAERKQIKKELRGKDDIKKFR